MPNEILILFLFNYPNFERFQFVDCFVKIVQENCSPRMNYKAKYGDGTSGIKKVQRVSDVNAMGYTSASSAPEYVSNTFVPDATYGYSDGTQINASVPIQSHQQRNFNPNYNNPTVPTNYPYSNDTPTAYGLTTGYPNTQPTFGQQSIYDPNIAQNAMPSNVGIGAAPFAMLNEPMVQDMAIQYGQKLADHGKQLVESHFEKYVPVTRLKYYFAVDNNYVVKKLILLFFPFTHSDWSLKYDQDNPVQPRFDINAPDLYIPTMAYITFVVLAGLVMGMQNQFSPEQLGIISSSALAYSLFELIIYSITLYVANISTTLKTLDLLSFSGYKFAVIDVCILVSIVFKRLGFWAMFIYSSLTLGFFLLRTLKTKILRDSVSTPAAYDAYGNVQQTDQFDYTIGRKRKLYFLFLVAGLQPILSFFLSMHLIPSKSMDGATTL